MALDEKLTAQTIQRLRSLRESMPNEDENLYRFGEYFADKLNGFLTLDAAQYYQVADQCVFNLRKGVDFSTNQPIRGPLVGLPIEFYDQLKTRIPDLAFATCPEDFAEKVSRILR